MKLCELILTTDRYPVQLVFKQTNFPVISHPLYFMNVQGNQFIDLKICIKQIRGLSCAINGQIIFNIKVYGQYSWFSLHNYFLRLLSLCS